MGDSRDMAIADPQEPQQPHQPRLEFTPIRVSVVDPRGRLYLPPVVCANIFAGIPKDQWQVTILLGTADAAGMVMLQVVRPGGNS